MVKPQKINGESLNPQHELLTLLQKQCPEVFTEGKIDPAKLKATLGEAVEADGERYGLSWAGKSDCFRHIQELTTATLVPDHKASVDFEATKNIFIEGDNLQALKVLQKSYYGKVKMIYIDPPYNTGSDSFIYPDRFQESKEEYMERIGQKEEGRLTRDGMWQANGKDNGYYHSNWLSMMYPRLFLARNLLRQDGAIFLSIDDHELKNLLLMMDEIFGQHNFIANLPTIMNLKGNPDSFGFVDTHEYTVVYARDKQNCSLFEFEIEEIDSDEWEEDDWGFYKRADTLRRTGQDAARTKRPKGWFPVFIRKNSHVYVTENDAPLSSEDVILWPISESGEELSWTWSKKKISAEAHNLLVIDGRNGKNIYKKQRLQPGEMPAKKPKSLFYKPEYSTGTATTELKKIFAGKLFNGPKPVPLIVDLLKIGSKNDDVILDFFAGSGTTAHAVMALNAEDGGNRRCISIQLGEQCDEESEAKKAGFNTIADIARERIRRAGKKVKEDTGANIDYGFKAFTLDESNFKIWRSDVGNAEGLAKQMEMFIDNVKKDSTQENILYELMLKTGLDLNTPIEKVATKAGAYFKLSGGKLVVCIEQGMAEELADKVLAEKPEKFICLDKAFGGNDQLKTNALLQMEQAGVDFLVI